MDDAAARRAAAIKVRACRTRQRRASGIVVRKAILRYVRAARARTVSAASAVSRANRLVVATCPSRLLHTPARSAPRLAVPAVDEATRTCRQDGLAVKRDIRRVEPDARAVRRVAVGIDGGYALV